MNNSYFWTSLFSSTALFHTGTPIHFAFSASSYVDKQTNKQTNKQKTDQSLCWNPLLNNSDTSIVKVNTAMRIKLTVNQNQTRTPTSAVELTTISYTYLTSDSCCVRTIGPMRVDQNTSPTLEKQKGINIQLLPVFKQRMCIYF